MNMFPRYVQSREVPYAVCVSVLCLMLAAPAWAQGASPWETAVNVLQIAFTSTIPRGLSLVAPGPAFDMNDDAHGVADVCLDGAKAKVSPETTMTPICLRNP
jgi:hypothetical protein